MIHGTSGNFKEFCDIFLTDCAPIGSMASHMLGFWSKRHESNVLFLTYEEMKLNLPSVVRKCAEFMQFGRPLTDIEVTKLCDHLNFSKMQKNPAVNLEPVINVMVSGTPIVAEDKKLDVKFIRKGQIGDWKNYMDEKLSKKFDLWIEKQFSGSGLKFIYE